MGSGLHQRGHRNLTVRVTSAALASLATYEGNLRVDDLAEQEFGLPYLTVAAALAFVTTQL